MEPAEAMETVISTGVQFTPQSFWTVMRLWSVEPNTVTPPILRADIHSDEYISLPPESYTQSITSRPELESSITHNSDSHDSSQNSDSNTPPPPPQTPQNLITRGCFRVLTRTLIPRQKRDTQLTQKIYYFSTDTEFRVLHVPVFTDSENPTPMELPFYHPKVLGFEYVYLFPTETAPTTTTTPTSATLQIRIIKFPPSQHLKIKESKDRTQFIWERVCKTLTKFAQGSDNGYTKRVNHDVVVGKKKFQDRYAGLKEKYAQVWIERWEGESTDPKKFVFEDILIATFLIELWSLDDSGRKGESGSGGGKVRFVDVGCGNGLLVHILSMEGYVGYGVDIAKRKIWDLYGPETRLEERVIDPKTAVFEDVDWIIGNHPDELTFWIPIFAHRSKAKFIIIPCCFHDFNGNKYNPTTGKPTLPFEYPMGERANSGSGYLSYLEHVEMVCRVSGYETERETLRIPSTKNVCVVGRKRNAEKGLVDRRIQQIVQSSHVVLRKTDRQLGRERESRRRDKAHVKT